MVKMEDGTNSGGNIDTVKQRATNANELAIRRAHNNLLIDTREYEDDFEYGITNRYFTNVIAENVYYQLNSEGNQTLDMSEIIDHQKDGSAVTKNNVYKGKHSNIPKKTTKGWDFLIE